LAGLGLLAVSAILLVAGAELFTENAAGAARHLRLTLFGVAFLLAGAEPEELITAVVASARHRPSQGRAPGPGGVGPPGGRLPGTRLPVGVVPPTACPGLGLIPVRLPQLGQLVGDPDRAGGAKRPPGPAAAPVAAAPAAVGAAQLWELVAAVAGPGAGLVIGGLAPALQAAVVPLGGLLIGAVEDVWPAIRLLPSPARIGWH
jgi:hypothetical protein